MSTADEGELRDHLAKLLHYGPRTDMMGTARHLADKLIAAGYRRTEATPLSAQSGTELMTVGREEAVSDVMPSAEATGEATEIARELMRRLWSLEFSHHDKSFELRVIDREHDEHAIAAALTAHARAAEERERERCAKWHDAKADEAEGAEADLPAIRREHCRVLAAQHRQYAAAIRGQPR